MAASASSVLPGSVLSHSWGWHFAFPEVFHFLGSKRVFPPSVPCHHLKGAAVPEWGDALGASFLKNLLRDEQLPFLLAEEFLPSSSVFSCGRGGL